MRPIQKAYLFFIALLMTITAYLVIASQARAANPAVYLPGVMVYHSEPTRQPAYVALYPDPGTYKLGFPEMNASVRVYDGPCNGAWISFTAEPEVTFFQYHMECRYNQDEHYFYADPLLSLYGPTVLTNVSIGIYDGNETRWYPIEGTWEYIGQ